MTEFGLNWTDLHSSTAMNDEIRDSQGFSYPRNFDARRAEGTIILDNLEGKPILLRNVYLGRGTTLHLLANSYGVFFEEPCDRCDCQTIGVVYGGVLGAKETKDGLRTKLGEREVGQEPRLRRGHIPLSHETQSVLGVKNLTRLRLKHQVIYLQ
jgi:hypothetical protein